MYPTKSYTKRSASPYFRNYRRNLFKKKVSSKRNYFTGFKNLKYKKGLYRKPTRRISYKNQIKFLKNKVVTRKFRTIGMITKGTNIQDKIIELVRNNAFVGYVCEFKEFCVSYVKVKLYYKDANFICSIVDSEQAHMTFLTDKFAKVAYGNGVMVRKQNMLAANKRLHVKPWVESGLYANVPSSFTQILLPTYFEIVSNVVGEMPSFTYEISVEVAVKNPYHEGLSHKRQAAEIQIYDDVDKAFASKQA